MSERDRFMDRLARAREAGLVNIGFCFRPTHPMKPEEIFRAMNEVEDAVRSGRRHTHWEKNAPPADTSPPR